ncbi:sensor histidine kinase [Xanthobacter agilis]|uniref:histidine kinase n=1 Tax=Xanthobacter agilis TaxID=47492 RepID=A0ABU0L9K3_XANAG|nr:ATP-binding protein [Xanthobacter agilis]MDQ0503809.1 signal transduction histidine kinase [Xanthobacter agilis]
MGRHRFGIAARLALILVGALALAQLLMLAAYMAERRRAEEARFTIVPLMVQIAAVVRLADAVDPAQRALALAAATSTGFIPRYLPAVPEIGSPPVLAPLAQRLQGLLGDDRTVMVAMLTAETRGEQAVERLRDLSGARLRVVVPLKHGGALEVTAGGDLVVRLLGLPVGLLAGVLGFLVAFVALLAVRREIRPLSDLAAVVERFGADLEPQEVAERGAPEVRAVTRAVNTMQARISELVRARALVLGAISHDLKTYLTRLRLRLELLGEAPQVMKAKADLDDMEALVNDALSYARAAFSGAHAEPVDLAWLARAEHDARLAQGAKVTLAGADTPHPVLGAPGALARVLANLAGNALAYGGCADMALAARADEVELRVEDRGPGIPPAARAAVFEPFYRLEPSRNRERGGAGLGLTIVRQIVEAHGGRVEISDRPGGGARVSVVLPRHLPEAGGSARAEPPPR